MASTNEEIGFDLDLLLPSQQTVDTSASKLEYMRKSIHVVKKKTLVSHALVTQVLALKKELDAAQNSLIASNKERDEWYTSYNHGCAIYKNLEVEIQKLQIKNKELEEKCFNSTNQCEALKSHANQLQLLVKENETQLEALKIENKLEKSCVKDHEKALSALKKKNEALIQELHSVKNVHGKNQLKKNHKNLIQKYKELNLFNDSDEFISGEEDNEDDVNIFNSVSNICDKNTLDNDEGSDQNSSALRNQNNADSILVDAKMKNSDNDHDSDCANEVISVDTGRGSSLAFSDSDKRFHSPDYVMGGSPLSIDTMDSNKDKRKYVDIGTSPIPEKGIIHIATSPIIFEDESSNLQTSVVKSVELVDRDISPIQITKHVDTSTSPIEKLCEGAISSSKKGNNQTNGNVHVIDHESASIHREIECLELNNSNNICDDKITDCEIESIFNTMRINHKLLTPIPLTPSKPREINVTQETIELKTQSRHSRGYICEEAAQVKEENKKLKASIDALANDVMSIKCLLQKQLLSINNKKDHSLHTLSNQEIIDDYNVNSNAENLRRCDRSSSKHLLDTNPLLHVSESKILQKQVNVTQHFAEKCAIIDSNKSEKLSTNNIGDAISQELITITSPSNITQILDQNDSVPTEELSASNTALIDDEISQDPITIKTRSDITQRLEFNDLVSPYSIITVPNEELSTSNKVVSDDDILHESIGIQSSTNVTPFNNSVSKFSITPTDDLSTNQIVVNDIEIVLEPIPDISSSYSSDANQNNGSVSSHSIAIDDLSANNIVSNDKTPQETVGNKLSLNMSLKFEGSTSSDELEGDINYLNDVSDTETTNLITLNNNEKQSDYETSNGYCLNRITKRKKLTKLDKLRKKMLPKSKISFGVKPLKKSCNKPKPLPIYKKHIKESDSAASLNDRSVYEKALKVMVELKSKQKAVNIESTESSLHSRPNICTEVTQSSPKKSNFIHHYDKNSNELPVSPRSAMMTRSRSKNDQNGQSSITRNFKLTFDEASNPQSLSKDENDTQETRKRLKRVSSIDKPEKHCKRMLRSSKVQHTNQQSTETETESETLIAKHSSYTCDGNVNSVKNIKTCVLHEPTDVHKSNMDTCSDLQIPSDKNDSVIDMACNNKNIELRVVVEKYDKTCIPDASEKESDQSLVERIDDRSDRMVSYSDLQMFSISNDVPKEKDHSEKKSLFESNYKNPKNSILCVMVQKYGMLSVKKMQRKLPESATNTICKMIEDKIASIIEVPATEIKDAMNEFVTEIQSLDKNLFMMGLMKYLKNPARRTELYNTVYSPPAPCMTKSEQVLLYVVTQLEASGQSTDIVAKILDNIEYTLFKLNQTPEFPTIESMSHIYAVICRYFKAKSRLRLFILDAMYCLQFKAIALIKQCIDVWMHILPLAHMGVAKSPLVTCLVYLLHYYKCEDKFNRVQDIRQILNRKYFYEITEWNEPKILDMFRSAIKGLKDISVEKKMLRMALIIIAKRHGPKWCQNNIIKNLLLPMIDMPNINNRVKHFCISMIGPLLKPYPVDMKVHCEVVVNQLLHMLQQNSSCAIQEAILASLIFMSKHNQMRVNQALLSWEAKRVSHEFESVLRDYVREKSVKIWKTIIAKIAHSV